jgi:hypothetical protein
LPPLRLLLPLSIIASLAGLACTGDDSGAGRDPAAASEVQAAGTCELPGEGYVAPCNECLAARCCAPIQSCKGDAACFDQLSCVVHCQYEPDPGSCSAACVEGGPHDGYLAYDDCSFDACLEECWM